MIGKSLKRCPRCGEHLDRAEFPKNRTTGDGLATYCRPCTRAKQAAYRKKQMEAVEQTRPCAHCLEPFKIPPRFPSQIFCSAACKRAASRRPMKVCPGCGEEFYGSHPQQTHCSRHCSKLGVRNPQWLGDGATEQSARRRSKYVIRSLEGVTCEHDGCIAPALDRHHIDGNTHNNDPSNLRCLCRKHHMVEDGRLARLHERAA